MFLTINFTPPQAVANTYERAAAVSGSSGIQAQPDSGVSVLGWNSDALLGYKDAQEFMIVTRSSVLRFRNSAGTINETIPTSTPRDPVSWLPSEIPSGRDRIVFVNDWSGETVGAELQGTYVIRHNLPAGYTISVSGGSNQTVVSPTRQTFEINSAVNLNISVIKGSSGSMPEGWFLQAFKEVHESLIDDATKDPLDARRHFRPEFLSLLQDVSIAEWRNMNWNEINDNFERIKEPSDLAPWDASHFDGIVPIEHQVAFCNYLNCDLFWCEWTSSSDTLIDRNATYIRDNLNSNLKCICEWSNEVWNFSFDAWNYASGAGLARPVGTGTQGAGTVSGTEGGFTITGVGTNFVSEFSGLNDGYLSVGHIMYEIDIPSLTATTAQVTGSQGIRRTFSGSNWWRNTSGNSERFRGQTHLATNVAKRFSDIFTATGERARLVNVMGGQLARSSGASDLLDPPNYSSDPAYIDPATLFDAVVVNPYFGNPWKNNATLKAEFKSLWDTNNQQGWRTLFKQIALETHPTYTEQGLPTIASWFRNHKDAADPFGLGIRTYECGYHYISGLSDTDGEWMLPQFQDYLNSQENRDVLFEWLDVQRAYTSGPVTTYKFMDAHGNSGTWGIWDNYSWYDGRVQWYLDVGDTIKPWWTTSYPPVARTVPAQSWENGVNPNFTLQDYVSVNATSFSGSVPAGMTLNTTTGDLSGAPTTNGNNDFSVTASNASGSVVVNVSVNVGDVPAFSAASTNTAGTEVYVDISGGPISGTAATTGFTVKANGHRTSLASASESADRITLVIDNGGPVLTTETLTVEYDGTGDWTNGSNQLPAFSAQAVTNNSTVSPDTTYSGNFTPDQLGSSGDDFSYTSGVDHIVDAYAATWNSRAPKNGGPDYPVTFRDRGGAKTTVVGLTSNGHHDGTTDWNTTYNVDSPRDNTANINMKNTGGFTILRNVHVTGYAWDAIRAESDTSGGVDTWLVEGAYVEFCRDDFIENDKNCSGTVRDCLFDNGFAGISFTPDSNSATGKSVTMEGVLSKVTPYLYNGVVTHFGPCVKLTSGSMTWSAENCVFAFDKHDHRTDYVSLGWSKLTASSNNYLLNLSDTNVSGSYPLPPSGWTFLQGQAARDKWNTERAAWLAAHGYS